VTADNPLLKPAPGGIEARPVTAAARLMLGGPVALVTTSWRGAHNVMPLAWHMPISTDPPLVAIAVEQSRHSVDMISHSQEFALNFPTRPLLHHVQYLGALHGDRVDKFEATQLETFSPTHISAPLLVNCAGWIECEVREVMPFGDHVLFIGLVMSVQVNPASFGEQWRLGGHEETQPLHFLGGNIYATLHRALEAKVPRDFEAPERVLRERLETELELTREARERREERLGELERELERGNVVDVSELDSGLAPEPEDQIDLSKGVVLGGGPGAE